MASWLVCRLRAAAAVLALVAVPASASDLALFNAAVEDAAAHNRVAIGYLRTDNVDLAVIEMERTKSAWAALTERFGSTPPVELAGNPRYTETLVGVPTQIVGASLMLTMGRTDLARNALQGIRKQLSAMRRASGIEVLADCVLDANAAMEPIANWDGEPPNLAEPAVAADVAAKADAFGKIMRRCDSLAPPIVRTQPEFRRLIDGALNGLSFIPKAIAERDNDLLHRVVGELRAFDNLLAFRYG
jgi:hypothetical protein